MNLFVQRKDVFYKKKIVSSEKICWCEFLWNLDSHCQGPTTFQPVCLYSLHPFSTGLQHAFHFFWTIFKAIDKRCLSIKKINVRHYWVMVYLNWLFLCRHKFHIFVLSLLDLKKNKIEFFHGENFAKLKCSMQPSASGCIK